MRALIAIVLLFVGAFAFENVDAKTFAKLMGEKDVVVLDVRTPSEYMQGHIQGSNLVPLQLFKYIYLAGKGVGEKKILVYCRSGNRSVEASKILESWGAKRVYNLKGGILEWRQKGLPLVK